MTGYTTLDAYEQFCENSAEYEDYAANPITDSILKHALIYGAGGLGVGGLGMTGMGIKGHMTKKALEEAAQENLLKGGLAGAGLVGAGVLGTKLAKKLLKKKKKKPFNSPSFSEYLDYEDYAVPDKVIGGYQNVMGVPASQKFMDGSTKYRPASRKARDGEYLLSPKSRRRRPAGTRVPTAPAATPKVYGPEDVHKVRMQGARRVGGLKIEIDDLQSQIAAANDANSQLKNRNADLQRQAAAANDANSQLKNRNADLQRQAGEANDANSRLKNRNAYLQRQAGEAQLANAKLAKTNSDLQGQIDSTQSMIDEATGKIYSPIDVGKYVGRQVKELAGKVKRTVTPKKGNQGNATGSLAGLRLGASVGSMLRGKK